MAIHTRIKLGLFEQPLADLEIEVGPGDVLAENTEPRGSVLTGIAAIASALGPHLGDIIEGLREGALPGIGRGRSSASTWQEDLERRQDWPPANAEPPGDGADARWGSSPPPGGEDRDGGDAVGAGGEVSDNRPRVNTEALEAQRTGRPAAGMRFTPDHRYPWSPDEGQHIDAKKDMAQAAWRHLMDVAGRPVTHINPGAFDGDTEGHLFALAPLYPLSLELCEACRRLGFKRLVRAAVGSGAPVVQPLLLRGLFDTLTDVPDADIDQLAADMHDAHVAAVAREDAELARRLEALDRDEDQIALASEDYRRARDVGGLFRADLMGMPELTAETWPVFSDPDDLAAQYRLASTP